MELNWSTFAFEVINFVILVWLLKHFLYQPVMNVIYERQRQVKDQLEEANLKETQALSLKENYENRLSDWEKEKQVQLQNLREEINLQRKQLNEQLQIELSQMRETAEAAEQLRLQDQYRQLTQKALDQSSEFCSRLMKDLACPELEARIIEKVIANLGTSINLKEMDFSQGNNSTADVIVNSAYPLDPNQQEQIRSQLNNLLGDIKSFHAYQNPTLIAGIQLNIGAFRLEASFENELKLFSQLSQAEVLAAQTEAK